MKTNTTKTTTRNLAAGALVLAAIQSVHAQDSGATEPTPESSSFSNFFTEDLPNWIQEGKFNLNARLRYEYADTSNTTQSHAPTLRTRFGYTTPEWSGFQAMIEGENVSILGSENNAQYPGNPPNGKTVVADPDTTEMNQYWLSYSRWDSKIKGPRQRIVLDNVRFVGDVGWRQNQQTFDAVQFQNNSIDDLAFTYAYLFQINRVFGSDNSDTINQPNAAAKGRWQSDSHIVHAKWTGIDYAHVTGYAYLLDLPTAAINSTASYGGFVDGSAPVTDDIKLSYRGEFAWQTDYQSSPVSYEAPYYHLSLKGDLYQRYTLGVGYEVLGSDNNQGFKTPLATLHAHNGWADVFLATPALGLQDMYASFGVKLPYEVPLTLVYHKFDSDKMSMDYGQEIDVVASRKFGKHWSALVKYAYYDGKDAPYAFDAHKLWAQVEFNF